MTTYSQKELIRRQAYAEKYLKEAVLPEIVKAAANCSNRRKIFKYLTDHPEVDWTAARKLVWVLHPYDCNRIKKLMDDYWYT